jgi:hypothetical protein
VKTPPHRLGPYPSNNLSLEERRARKARDIEGGPEPRVVLREAGPAV